MARSVASRAVGGIAAWLDHRYGWDKLPVPLGLLSIAGLRATLRAQNLVDTNTPGHPPSPAHGPPDELESRTPDGTYNDLQNPQMGAMAARFGRNVPLPSALPEAEPGLLEPNVRVVSRELLTRETFQPATIINLLVAAWLQFMVHDWMSHGPNEADNPFLIPLDEADPWDHGRPMEIQRTQADRTRAAADGALPPTYTNTETHWWDASQLYGTNPPPDLVDLLRAHEEGKVRLDENHLIPFDPSRFEGKGIDVAGVSGNWWLGLGILHSLFMQEHNAVCDALRRTYPSWSDDQLFARARLIVAGLLAKIHTVEWTPAIITHPTSKKAMHINWYGAAPAWMRNLLLPLHNEVLTGIPGSKKDHDGAPYCLTEEFVAVYRMHPLIPDEFTFRSASTGDVILEKTFREIAGTQARATLEGVPMEDLLYSFGVANAGAVRLRNFPRFLQEFVRPDGTVIDLAATDILRSRERGVPRYNEFRRLLHMRPYESFSVLCPDDPALARAVEEVYDGKIDRVDTSVGMFAEPLPAGFGFSDTAFRIFILMASRRLRSDRFFTTDFTPQVYTPLGMRWIQQTTMGDVIRRHYPSLAGLVNPENAFAPWAPKKGSG